MFYKSHSMTRLSAENKDVKYTQEEKQYIAHIHTYMSLACTNNSSLREEKLILSRWWVGEPFTSKLIGDKWGFFPPVTLAPPYTNKDLLL